MRGCLGRIASSTSSQITKQSAISSSFSTFSGGRGRGRGSSFGLSNIPKSSVQTPGKANTDAAIGENCADSSISSGAGHGRSKPVDLLSPNVPSFSSRVSPGSASSFSRGRGNSSELESPSFQTRISISSSGENRSLFSQSEEAEGARPSNIWPGFDAAGRGKPVKNLGNVEDRKVPGKEENRHIRSPRPDSQQKLSTQEGGYRGMRIEDSNMGGEGGGYRRSRTEDGERRGREGYGGMRTEQVGRGGYGGRVGEGYGVKRMEEGGRGARGYDEKRSELGRRGRGGNRGTRMADNRKGGGGYRGGISGEGHGHGSGPQDLKELGLEGLENFLNMDESEVEKVIESKEEECKETIKKSVEVIGLRRTILLNQLTEEAIEEALPFPHNELSSDEEEAIEEALQEDDEDEKAIEEALPSLQEDGEDEDEDDEDKEVIEETLPSLQEDGEDEHDDDEDELSSDEDELEDDEDNESGKKSEDVKKGKKLSAGHWKENYLDAAHVNHMIEFEPEYSFGEFESNPDIEEKPPISLRAAFEKAKPFLMPYVSIESEEHWEDVMEEVMADAPQLKALVRAYSGPAKLSAMKVEKKLAKVADSLPENTHSSLKNFTDRALISLKSNPHWAYNQKFKFMGMLKKEIDKLSK